MKTVQINTNLFVVAIHSTNTTEYTAQNRLVTQPDDAQFYDEEEAEFLVEKYQAMYPYATVQKELVKETLTTDQLAEKIADIYNSRTAGWDFQHCGQSRNYEYVEEAVDKLESTLFCGSDIKHAIERDLDMVIDMDDVMTLDAWAEFVADAVGQKIAKINYGDVTFIIYLKK